MKLNIDRYTGRRMEKAGAFMELYEVLRRIEESDDLEISEIIRAVIQRYHVCFPDWEIIFLSLPRNDPQERERGLEELLSLARKWS